MTYYLIKEGMSYQLVTLVLEDFNHEIFLHREIIGKEEEIFKNNKGTELVTQNDVKKFIEEHSEDTVLVYSTSFRNFFVYGADYLKYLNKEDSDATFTATGFYRDTIVKCLKCINEDNIMGIIESLKVKEQ